MAHYIPFVYYTFNLFRSKWTSSWKATFLSLGPNVSNDKYSTNISHNVAFFLNKFNISATFFLTDAQEGKLLNVLLLFAV